MIRTILTYPDPGLKKKSEPVQGITPEIIELAKDMAETMYKASGVGLAAPQVGALHRIIVMDVSGKDDPPDLITVINPVIVHAEGKSYEDEGCLSVPKFSANVHRSSKVTVKGMKLDGSEEIWEAEGLLAVAFQHEIDHLDGILFVDRLSPLKRDIFRRKARKMAEQGKRGES